MSLIRSVLGADASDLVALANRVVSHATGEDQRRISVEIVEKVVETLPQLFELFGVVPGDQRVPRKALEDLSLRYGEIAETVRLISAYGELAEPAGDYGGALRENLIRTLGAFIDNPTDHNRKQVTITAETVREAAAELEARSAAAN